MEKSGIGRVTLVQLASPIDTVVANRIINLVPVEVDSRLNPNVVPRLFRLRRTIYHFVENG